MFSGFTSTTDPLRRWRQRLAALAVGAVTVLIPTVAWALRPLPPRSVPPLRGEPMPATVELSDEAPIVDRSVFERNLWWTLPKPGIGPDALPTPKTTIVPMAVDLIGVISIDGALVAALYDRRADRLLLVRHGETIADAKVSELTNDRVTLTRDDGEMVLVRRRPGP